jgi:hypothetical protein
MSNVIDLMSRRREASEVSAYEDLPDDLRLDLNRALVGFRLDPANFSDAELSDITDALIDAAFELGGRLMATPGLVIV